MCALKCSEFSPSDICLSDEVSLMREMWETINPMGKLGQFAVFKAYMDDSEHRGIFTLCALVGRGITWDWVNADWRDLLDKKNAELAKQGRPPLSCYHATDCSNGYKEFKDWSKDERNDFTKKILGIFSGSGKELVAYSVSASLDAIVDVIPEAAADPKAFASVFLLTTVMQDIADGITSANDQYGLSRCKVAIVHENGNYDGSLGKAFDSAIDNGHVRKGLFTTIVPMGWEDCISLQPTDFMTYEHCKEVERIYSNHERGPRFTFQRISSDEMDLVGKGSYFAKDNLLRLKDEVAPIVIQQFLLDANLAKTKQRK